MRTKWIVRLWHKDTLLERSRVVAASDATTAGVVARRGPESYSWKVVTVTKAPSKGDRIRCLGCSDPLDPIPAGSLGTVSLVDDAGTVHVDWDSGRTLGLVPWEDSFELVPG